MCEHWAYGCGHDVRIRCPRPKPGISSNPSSIQSTPSRHSSTSSGSTASTISVRTPNNNGNGVFTVISPPDNPMALAFCKGFPLVAKETDYPCYACIQADARANIVREAPEVQAEKERLKEQGVSRPSGKVQDGSYTDEWGRKITKEDAFYQEESYGRTQTRTLSGARGRGASNFSGNARGNGFGGQNGCGTNLDPARENNNTRPRGFTDGDGGGYGAFGRRGGFSGASSSNSYAQSNGYARSNGPTQGNGYVPQSGHAEGSGYVQLNGHAQSNGFAQQSGYGGHGPGYAPRGQTQQPVGNGPRNGPTWANTNGGPTQQAHANGNINGRAWGNTNGFGQTLNGYNSNGY